MMDPMMTDPMMMAYEQPSALAPGAQQGPNNTWKYVGVGLGLLAVAGAGYYFWTKKKEEQ